MSKYQKPRIVVITGAGSSAAAGMPLAIELRDLVIDRLANDSETGVGKRLASILRTTVELFSTAQGSENPRERNPDLEFLLDRLLSIASLPNDALSEQWRNIPAYDMATLTSVVTKHVVDILYTDSKATYLANMGDLLSAQNPLWVFTLNHDVCFEAALAEARIPYTAGFGASGLWDASLLDCLPSGVIVYKLHGSVDWVRDTYQTYPFRRGEREEVLARINDPCRVCTFTYLNDFKMVEYETPVIHFGGRTKFVLEYPFLHFINKLDFALKSAAIIILIGYSMLDRHVGHLINQSFHHGRKTIIQVDPRPLVTENDQTFAAILLSHLGARASQWESTQTQLLLHKNMRFIALPGKAENPSTWKELTTLVKTLLSEL